MYSLNARLKYTSLCIDPIIIYLYVLDIRLYIHSGDGIRNEKERAVTSYFSDCDRVTVFAHLSLCSITVEQAKYLVALWSSFLFPVGKTLPKELANLKSHYRDAMIFTDTPNCIVTSNVSKMLPN